MDETGEVNKSTKKKSLVELTGWSRAMMRVCDAIHGIFRRSRILYVYVCTTSSYFEGFPHLVVVVEEVSGKRLHLLRPRGTPHERLPVRANLTHDLADLGLEPHVQHAVSFIQHLEILEIT